MPLSSKPLRCGRDDRVGGGRAADQDVSSLVEIVPLRMRVQRQRLTAEHHEQRCRKGASHQGNMNPRMVKKSIAASAPDTGTVINQAATIRINAERLTNSVL